MSRHRRLQPRVPVEPLQRAVRDSGLTHSEICFRLGWTKRSKGQRSGDTSRLQRSLGLRNESHSYNRSPNQRISLRNALRIADAIGLDPHTIEEWLPALGDEPAQSHDGRCGECGEEATWTDSWNQERCERCWAIVVLPDDDRPAWVGDGEAA